MQKIKGYWRTEGKHPKGTEANRILLEHPPKKGNYCAVYGEGFIQIDIDDYDHNTGELVEPVNGSARSEAVVSFLDSLNYQYDGITTDKGKHLIFRIPENYPYEGNKINWYCAIGIRIEAKITKPVELLQVNGHKRTYFKGGIDNLNIDVLPRFLYPLQKTKNKPFLMKFEAGDRNNHLSEYAFYLANKGFSAEEVDQAIKGLNSFFLADPLPDPEIDTILRPETMEKLQDIEEQKKNGSVSPETFTKFLKSLGMSIRYNELLNIVEYENIPTSSDYQEITDIQNVMPIKLMYEFRKFTGKQNITKHQVIDLILLEADTHTYNPVKQFLQSAVWDGKDRFPDLFRILGVTDDLQKSFIKKWFYQTAGIPFNSMDKPFQAEGVLILQGAEGIGKTRFFQQLAVNPLWFSSLDKELTTKNKDILIQMLSVWIAEIGEVDRTFKANKSDVKSFITSRDDTIRKPYRMEQVKKARTTSFCGTTNKTTFLNDDTGSRRWWVIPVNKKITVGDFAKKENLLQFWSQCYQAFCSDPNCFRLTDAEMEVLKEVNKESMELLPSEEELRNRFDFEAPETEWNWTTASALKNLPEYDVDKYTVQQIGKALTAISQDDSRITQRRTKSGRLWFIPPVIRNTDRFRNRK